MITPHGSIDPASPRSAQRQYNHTPVNAPRLYRPVVRLLFAALCLLPLASLNASTKLYLAIENIEGESIDKGFEKQIDVYSFSWGAMNVGTARTVAAKPEVSDLAVMKKLDASSPALLAKVVKGEIIPKITLTAVRVLKDTVVPILELEMFNVLVSSLQESDSAGGDPVPTESVSFNCQKIKFTFIAADGTKTSTEWSAAGVR